MLYIETVKNIFNYSGRARRLEYWTYHVLTLLVYVGFSILAKNTVMEEGVDTIEGLGIVFYIISVIITTCLFLISLSLTIRRLHDINFSAWWVLLYMFAFPVLTILTGLMQNMSSTLATITGISGMVIPVVLWLLIAFKGSVAHNQWGQPGDPSRLI